MTTLDLDLDDLEAKRKAALPICEVCATHGLDDGCGYCSGEQKTTLTALSAAAVNALQPLIDRIRELELILETAALGECRCSCCQSILIIAMAAFDSTHTAEELRRVWDAAHKGPVMAQPTPDELAELERVADAATPGERTHRLMYGVTVMENDPAGNPREKRVANCLRSKDAEFIAAFDRPMAMRLLARIRDLEQRASLCSGPCGMGEDQS